MSEILSDLETSRDHYYEAVEHEKRQFRLNLALGSAGAFLTGMCVTGAAAGFLSNEHTLMGLGFAGTAAGFYLTAVGAEGVWQTLEKYAEMRSLKSQRELQIQELSEED